MAGNNNNGKFIAIAAVAVVALAGGGYYFMSKGDDSSGAPAQEQASNAPESQETETAAVETAAGDATDKVEAPSMNTGDFVVEEGNPVVAKVDGKDITRVDVYRFIRTMPANVQQLPATAVYPMAMEQVINTRLVQNKANNANITETDDYKKEMDIAGQQIARNLYLQQQVDKKITDSKLKKAYNDYIAKVPDVEQRRARHILVETESKATAVIDKLKTGDQSFEELAASLSIGPTASKGGDLGYFSAKEMVPEFAQAAFAMKKGDVSTKPVQTQFGWHVIKLEDVRQQPKPTFEQMKAALKAEESRKVLEDLLKGWRKDAKIEQFDINGKPLKDGANVIGIVPEKKEQPKKDG